MQAEKRARALARTRARACMRACSSAYACADMPAKCVYACLAHVWDRVDAFMVCETEMGNRRAHIGFSYKGKVLGCRAHSLNRSCMHSARFAFMDSPR
eukprot:6185214-Pleurochrysis_carterae.AAC.2